MTDTDWLAARFEERRTRLRAVAYRMLGSVNEADDAVQDAWIRLSRSDVDAIENLDGWLTTVVARVCLNRLRSRRTRGEEPLDAEVRVPDPIVSPDRDDPEDGALLADSVGLALLVVLETLSPAERLAFVLHDLFAVPFDEIAEMLDRSPAAARQLASRARRRVQGQAPVPDPDRRRQREVVDAFFAAANDGDFDALVAVLDPEVALRSDGGSARPKFTFTLRGAPAVAEQALAAAGMATDLHPVLVNGAAAVLVAARGRPLYLMAFTVTDGRIAAIDVLADPDRLEGLPVPRSDG